MPMDRRRTAAQAGSGGPGSAEGRSPFAGVLGGPPSTLIPPSWQEGGQGDGRKRLNRLVLDRRRGRFLGNLAAGHPPRLPRPSFAGPRKDAKRLAANFTEMTLARRLTQYKTEKQPLLFPASIAVDQDRPGGTRIAGGNGALLLKLVDQLQCLGIPDAQPSLQYGR